MDIRPLFLRLTAVVDSKVKASKSGASDSPNPKTSTHPRSKHSLHKPFFPMSRRFLLPRAFPPSLSQCQQSSGHDARETDAQLFHRAATGNLRLACGCCSCMCGSTQTDLLRQCKTIEGLKPNQIRLNKQHSYRESQSVTAVKAPSRSSFNEIRVPDVIVNENLAG